MGQRASVLVDEPDDFALGPVAVITRRRAFDVAAVTTMVGDDDGDARVAGHGWIAKWVRRDKRIVSRRENQRRHADLVYDPHRARAMVVIGRAIEAVVRRGVGLVALAHCPYGSERCEI